MTRTAFLIVVSTILIVSDDPAVSQERGAGIESVGREILSFYLPFVFPKIFQDVTRLRDLIRDDQFREYRLAHGDLMAVDLIYHESLKITWGNRYEALLICTFAVMDHRNFGVRLPLIGSLLWFPLSSEFDDQFQARIGNLPVRLYPDTPPSAAGDRDKLQHFFGSAFLAFFSESREGTVRVGLMVEYGESEFIVGGRHDDRDLRANQHGQSFGMALLRGADVSPSDFLQLHTAGSAVQGDESLTGVDGRVCGLENATIQYEER